ncbi:MAG: ABC transporter ATP-binding protein [Halanaerobiaceae bacterium]|jgi:energy-coupling factor transport system ATP-binding protein|nr:ABC transporter ATP-binding protein [Halanaerobiaceae bacterium]
MIRLQNVCFNYDRDRTLTDISFHINKGEFAAIIGANGAGKSTLCRLLNGLLKPSSGSVEINGLDTGHTKSSVLARQIGFLFQNPDRQICRNTVAEEILFGLELLYKDREFIAERLEKVLSMFGFSAEDNPFNLSRGERQRLALASLIAVEPEILILDEPTTGLDYKECIEIMEIVREMNKKGTTVIMVCHDMEVVLDYAERVLVLSGGKLIADGETRSVFCMNDVLEQASLIPPQMASLAGRLGSGFEDVFTVEEMTELILEKSNEKRRVEV